MSLQGLYQRHNAFGDANFQLIESEAFESHVDFLMLCCGSYIPDAKTELHADTSHFDGNWQKRPLTNRKLC